MVGSRCMTDSFEARSDLADLSGRLGRLRMSAHAGMSMLPLTGQRWTRVTFRPSFPRCHCTRWASITIFDLPHWDLDGYQASPIRFVCVWLSKPVSVEWSTG